MDPDLMQTKHSIQSCGNFLVQQIQRLHQIFTNTVVYSFFRQGGSQMIDQAHQMHVNAIGKHHERSFG